MNIKNLIAVSTLALLSSFAVAADATPRLPLCHGNSYVTRDSDDIIVWAIQDCIKEGGSGVSCNYAKLSPSKLALTIRDLDEGVGTIHFVYTNGIVNDVATKTLTVYGNPENQGGPQGVDFLFTGLPSDLPLLDAIRILFLSPNIGTAHDVCTWN